MGTQDANGVFGMYNKFTPVIGFSLVAHDQSIVSASRVSGLLVDTKTLKNHLIDTKYS